VQSSRNSRLTKGVNRREDCKLISMEKHEVVCAGKDSYELQYPSRVFAPALEVVSQHTVSPHPAKSLNQFSV